ncbi:MAG: heme peroxidase [Acidobacteria bacterium]|nr:heme peroxidase [Acidobacteriota bacterium]
MTKPTNKERSLHGALPVRGSTFEVRSPQFEGKFGRLFRSLPPATWSEAALRELAGDGHKENRMAAEPEQTDDTPPLPIAPREDLNDDGHPRTSRLHDDEENSGIDAGFTYLGQFIDHDLTFDPASSLQQINDVDALVDFRTPRFDLDSVYGRGPDDQPYIYNSDGRTFQLGRELTEGIGGKVIAHDLPRHNWTEADGRQFHRALIGDKRNDENVIVAQLHSIFLQFHNRMATERTDLTFAQVQRQVRWHYQYVVLHDFLFKIARRDVIERVLPHLKHDSSILDDPPRLYFYNPRNSAFMPVEFSVAAYRFGHSMVRPIYRLNTKLTGGNNPDQTKPNERERGIDGRQFIFAGLKERGLNGFDSFPQEWGIDWDLFFDLSGNKERRVTKKRTQPAYKIDTSLVNPLAFLPEFSDVNIQSPPPPLVDVGQLQPPPLPGQIPVLALRNLLRGLAMGLPSGQDVALAMNFDPLRDDQLKVGKATVADEYDDLPTLVSLSNEFAGKAPLWYYILAESQHDWRKRGGDSDTPVQLGKVGSRIVVETFAGILLDDGHSVLRQAPGWHPEIGKKKNFDMADFIKFALRLDH